MSATPQTFRELIEHGCMRLRRMRAARVSTHRPTVGGSVGGSDGVLMMVGVAGSVLPRSPVILERCACGIA